MLVSWGLHNKEPTGGGGPVLSHSSGGLTCKIEAWPELASPVASLFPWLGGGGLSSLSPWSSLGHVPCILIAAAYKERQSHRIRAPTVRPHSTLITHLKTRSPNTVTFRGKRG